MSTLRSFQSFFVFVQFFTFKNTLKKSQNKLCNDFFGYILGCLHLENVLGVHLYQLITCLSAHLSHLNVPCVFGAHL